MSEAARRWLELSVRPPAGGDAAAVVTEVLLGLGARAVEERGGRLVTHLADVEDAEALRASVQGAVAALTGGAALEIDVAWQADEDWATTWREGLDTRHVTDRLVVTPSWIPYEGRSCEIVLRLDPGMAFGTAEHGTTRGCLRLLDATVTVGERVIDVGAGSGVLSLAAAALGAADVVALEGDPLACEVLEENREAHAAEVVRVVSAWADADVVAGFGPRDGIVANLETGVLRPLVSGFRRALRPGGWLIVSGILAAEWPGLRPTLEDEGFELRTVDEDGSWRSALLLLGGRESGDAGH